MIASSSAYRQVNASEVTTYRTWTGSTQSWQGSMECILLRQDRFCAVEDAKRELGAEVHKEIAREIKGALRDRVLNDYGLRL